MMNRASRETRNTNGVRLRDWTERLDLFSRIQHRQPVASLRDQSKSNTQTLQHASERTGVGSMILGKGRMDEFFSLEGEKNDYDWLLTPPETPLLASPETRNYRQSSVVGMSSTPVRSVSASKVSRFSASQTDNASSFRPVRSSSTTRTSLSKTNSISSYLSTDRNSVLNTSTASVTSKPSTTVNRSVGTPTARTTPTRTTRTSPSCSTTPIRNRQSPTSPADKPRPLQNSRPATPTPRPATPTCRPKTPSKTFNSSSGIRPNSRPSTPARQKPEASSPSTASSKPVNRVSETNERKTSTVSRPSSPARRPRTPVQQFSIPDFPLDVPPNLRTRIPERAASASRQRPGMALTVPLDLNSGSTVAVMSSNRRQASSPVSTRGRHQENLYEHAKNAEKKKCAAVDGGLRRQSKPSASSECNGFGRTAMKKSIDVPAKPSDTRQCIGARGTSVFPHSIRSMTLRTANKVASCDETNQLVSENSSSSRKANGGGNAGDDVTVKKLDIYESSRYDAMLFKEDVKSMNWLHSIEDMPDQSPVFDHRFASLPEPFAVIR